MGENAQKQKLAVLVDSYSRGGVAMALQTFLQFLPKERYEITLFVRKYEEGNMLPLPEGVRCCPWEEGTVSSPVNRLRGLLSLRNFAKKQVFDARCRKSLSGDYDCAIGYQMVANDVAVMTLEKVSSKRKVLWLHGQKKFREQDLAFYDALYAQADQIVCVSLETEERFKRLMPVSGQKTITIHNLYDISNICQQAQAPAEGMQTQENGTTIVSVGRISKEKGFDRVPEVMERLLNAGYDLHWYIVGDGNTRADLEEDIIRKNLQERVHLLGHRANPYPYVQNCDIYVQPSYTEGFCTSTMEAKILCKPSVVTDISGMREQFADGENGLIVESSVEGLYEGIRRLLDDPALRERIVNKLRTEPVPNDEVLRQTIEAIEGKPLEK